MPKRRAFVEAATASAVSGETSSPVRTKDKVAIVGSASSSVQLAPYNDPSFEIWGLGWRPMPRCDRWFEMHQWKVCQDVGPLYLKMLAECKQPVYMIEKRAEVPSSIRFPIELMTKKYGPRLNATGERVAYWASSIAYMVALAIEEQFKRIEIWGVDMLTDGEYQHQRPNLEWLLGIAEGRGIETYVPPQSALLKMNYIYGYDDEDRQKARGITMAYLKEQAAKSQQQRDQHQGHAVACDGARQAYELMQAYLENWERGGVVPASQNPDVPQVAASPPQN